MVPMLALSASGGAERADGAMSFGELTTGVSVCVV